MPCISLKIILFAFISSFVVKLNEAQTYTFTNAGAKGREGPTQAQIDSNYSNTNLAGKVTIKYGEVFRNGLYLMVLLYN